MISENIDEPVVAPSSANVITRYLSKSLSIADIFERARKTWAYGLAGLILGSLAGIYVVWTTPPNYSVSIGLLPMESSGSDLSESAGALGALAGLTGLSSGPVPKYTRFMAALNTTGVAEIMNRDHDMICRTFSDCDIKTHKWHKHSGFKARINRWLARLGHLSDPDNPRTALDLSQYTKANIQPSSDKTTRILTLNVETRDPVFMRTYLILLVQSANKYVKEQDRNVIQRYVEYLYSKLATTTNISQREALSSLVLEQERKLMLAAVDVPYAANIQDGPNTSESNNPARTLIVDSVIGLLLGSGLGILLSFMFPTFAWRMLFRRA